MQTPFPSYNHHRSISSNSGSWIGGLFSPKFTTISANTAAKSASLSFAQMQSFTGFSSVATNSGHYDLEASFDARQGRRRVESSSSSDREHVVHGEVNDSMSIPYNSASSLAATTSSNTFANSASGPSIHSTSNSFSSSSGCSTQSGASSASNSLSTHPSFTRANKARSSLREAAANFRDFVQHYERGLM